MPRARKRAEKKINMSEDGSSVTSGHVVLDPSLTDVTWAQDTQPSYVHLTGEIDEGKASEFETAFRTVLDGAQPQIVVMIHSPGGDLYSAFKIVDMIQASTKPVITVANGMAMSAAALIFSLGQRRYITTNSTVMLHDASMEGMGGKLKDIEAEAKELKRLNGAMWRVMAQSIGKQEEFFVEATRANTDTYVTPEKALEWGLATHAGLPRLVTRISVETAIEDMGQLPKKRRRRA